jgi:hypothetical protein
MRRRGFFSGLLGGSFMGGLLGLSRPAAAELPAPRRERLVWRQEVIRAAHPMPAPIVFITKSPVAANSLVVGLNGVTLVESCDETEGDYVTGEGVSSLSLMDDSSRKTVLDAEEEGRVVMELLHALHPRDLLVFRYQTWEEIG